MSCESSVRRKSASQTSLSKKDSKNQSETKRLIQEETVEQGSVSGLSTAGYFLIFGYLCLCHRAVLAKLLCFRLSHSFVRLFFQSDVVTTMPHEQLEQF